MWASWLVKRLRVINVTGCVPFGNELLLTHGAAAESTVILHNVTAELICGITQRPGPPLFAPHTFVTSNMLFSFFCAIKLICVLLGVMTLHFLLLMGPHDLIKEAPLWRPCCVSVMCLYDTTTMTLIHDTDSVSANVSWTKTSDGRSPGLLGPVGVSGHTWNSQNPEPRAGQSFTVGSVHRSLKSTKGVGQKHEINTQKSQKTQPYGTTSVRRIVWKQLKYWNTEIIHQRQKKNKVQRKKWSKTHGNDRRTWNRRMGTRGT